MEKIKLKLFGISEIVGIEDVALLSLLDERQERQLIVTCDIEMRKSLQMHMMKKPETSKLFPRVMANILQRHPFSELEVRINNVRDGEYITEIYDSVSDEHYPIRCSDGILFSIVADVPIYAPMRLMLRQSVPFKMGEQRVGLPLSVLSEKLLKTSLERAIETENYEMASNLRDELNKRHTKQ